MSLPREWSFQESCRMVDRGLGPGPTATASQEAVGPIIDENMNQQNQLGSLFSIHSAPVFDINNGITSPKRPASLVVQVTATSTPLVPPHASPPDTIDDEDNDNLLTISSLTARPLIAKSRELRSSRYRPRSKRPKKVSRPKNPNLVPLDGGYGWVIVFGAFFVQFWVAGLVKSYGVLYVEVMETFKDSSASVASWIPAILSCLCLALAPVTSMLCQKYSCRAVVFVGGLFCALGLTISYFATSLVHLFFTFGVLTGIGGGLSTTPGIVIVSQYFDKHRALANGICVSGTAAGSFVFPLLIERLVASFGFHGTILLLGGCMLHVCVSATLYRPLEDNCVEETAEEIIEKTEVLKEPLPTKQQKLDLLFANDATTRHNLLNELFHQNAVVAVELTDSEEEKDIMGEALRMKPISKIRSSSILHSVEDLSTDSTCVYKARSSLRSLRSSVPAVTQKPVTYDQPTLPEEPAKSFAQKITRYIDLSLLKDPQFIMMCLSVSLMSTGSPYMLYYLPAYVHAAGYTKSEAGYLVAISAVLDLCGRLGLGWLSDLQLFDRRKGYIGSIVGAGVAVLAIPMAHSFYVLACSVGMYGLCLGCWFLLVPVLLADQYGTDKISSSYGLVRMFQSVGAISIPPLAGYLRDVTGSYAVCFLCMGTCMVLGGLPMLLVPGEHSKPTRAAERSGMTRRVSNSASLKKAGRSNQRCESGCRTGRSHTARGIRKRCRIRAGWRHEWISRTQLPPRSVLAIRQVVRGPFSSPRLVGASPYVLISSYCKDEDPETCKSAARCPRIKRGIPDAWAEYLAYRGFCSKNDRRIIRRDIELGCKNIYVTVRVWKNLGLPLGQGIPDPWKIPEGSESWVSGKAVKLQAEKRQRQRNHQYCGYCKRCQATTRISPHRDYCGVDKNASGVDQTSLNPSPQQKTKGKQVCQEDTLQHRQSFIPETSNCSPECPLINKSEISTAPCNTHGDNHRPINVIVKPTFPPAQTSTDMPLTSPDRLEYHTVPRGEQPTLGKPQQQTPNPPCEAKSYQPQVCPTKLSRALKNAKKLINSGVQMPEMVPIISSPDSFVQQKFIAAESADQTTPPQSINGFRKKGVHSSLNKATIPSHLCGCRYQEQFPGRDVACACQYTNIRKKTVGFETRDLQCNKATCNCGRHNLNQNLNVTRLSCGCVHVSPCIGMQEYFGAANGCTGFGPRGDTPFPENAFHGESIGQIHNENLVRKPNNVKPKMISRMKGLINRYKPTSRPHNGAGRAQRITSEIPVSEIPNEAKLVCCQCNCPYFKVGNSSQEVPPKTVAKKKKKCVCGRCVEKRERRERRRSKKAAVQEQEISVGPRSCGRSVHVEPDQPITTKCRDESCRTKNVLCYNETLREDLDSLQGSKQKAIMNPEESYSPSAPHRNSSIRNEMKGSCEITENLSADVISLEAWQYPAVLGAPWYSSDSGENADVSELSRNTVKCTSMLEVSPEASLVTSCTFISRINYSTVFQCKKKQQRRSKREERLKTSLQDAREIDSESPASRNSLPFNSSQTPTTTNGSYKHKIIPNQISLPYIEELKSKDFRKASSRMVCVDPPTGIASFYKEEEMSETSSPTNRYKNRENSFEKRATSMKKKIRKKPNDSTVDGSQVTIDGDSKTSYNRVGHSPSRRTHLILPKTLLVLDDIENSTNITNEKLRVSKPCREVRKFENPSSSEDVSDSSKSSRSSNTDSENPSYNPMITTNVSPRKISTISSTSCNPASCTRKCRKAPVPMNTPTDGVSSEDQGFPSGKQNVFVYRCELPFAKGPCIAKSPVLSNKTRKSLDSTPRYAICSPAKVNGFLEGESVRNFDFNMIEKSENESPREYVKEVRTLVQNGIYQGGKKSLADNKCFLKYCSLRRSEPCVLSPSRKLLRIQQPSYLSNDNDEDGVSGMAEREFPLGRRTFSNCSNQRNPTILHGEAFDRGSTHLLEKVQDKFNIR